MTVPSISAVLVAWNAGDTLAACVESLRIAAVNAGTTLELVVVDNASDDGAVEAVAWSARDRVVRNPVNAGYGVAASQGLALATAPWVLLANPDLVVSPDFLRALERAAFDAPDHVATLVPELRFSATGSVVNCRGVTFDTIGVPAEVDAGRPVAKTPSTRSPLGGSSGCCLLRADAVRAVGGLELVYFAYLEDVDLAVRLARAGYQARLVEDAVAFHHGSAAAGAISPLKTYLVARNRRLLFRLEGPHGVGARLRRTLIEIAHGVTSSLLSSSLTPWSGRADALRLRRYTRFVGRSRRLYDVRNAAPAATRPPSLASTLARKRAVVGAAERHEEGVDAPVANDD